MPIVNGIRGGPKSLLFDFFGQTFLQLFWHIFLKKARNPIVRLIFQGFGGNVFRGLFACSSLRGIKSLPTASRSVVWNFAPPLVFLHNYDSEISVFTFFWSSHRYDGLEVDHCLCWSSRWLQIYIGGGGILDAFWTAQLKVFLVLFASTFCRSWNLNAGILFLAIFEKSFDLVRMYARVWVHPGAGCAPKAPFTQVM